MILAYCKRRANTVRLLLFVDALSKAGTLWPTCGMNLDFEWFFAVAVNARR